MKRRLLLSALSCVLALGLVTACNDEEEDLSGGDSGTQTDGGGSSGDTSGTGGGSGDTSGSGGGSGDTGTGGGSSSEAVLENFTVTYHFTDETGTESYAIPDYADGYVTGYLTSSSVWTNYEIGGSTKLEGNAETGYSVTFEQLVSGTVTYNIYFEYNSSATNHSAAESPSWNASHSIGGSANTTMTIPSEGTSTDVYVVCNPEELITDEAPLSLTIGLKDTDTNAGTTDKEIYISGSMNGWTAVQMTYDSTGTDYQYSQTFEVGANEEISLGIFKDSNWNDSIQFGTVSESEYWNSGNNIGFAGSVIGENAQTLIILTADCSGFGGTSHVTTTAVSITHPTVTE